ncbi:MAG: hypothetical protein P4L84_08125 [Isosphaeraceae bacterium]|nr:hypothetical protein [Isosphaeraceae bacterium]
MSPKRGQGPAKLPLVLLGLMSLATFGGPFVIALVIGGGRRSSWPPDRPVEWWTFGLICGAVAVLMSGCLVFARGTRRNSGRPNAARGGEVTITPSGSPFVRAGVHHHPPPSEGGAGGGGSSQRDEPSTAPAQETSPLSRSSAGAEPAS